MKRKAKAHIMAFLAAFIALVAVCALWIVSLPKGPRLDGLTAGPMVVFVPFGLVIFTLIWFFIRAAMHTRMQWRVISVLAVTIVVPLVVLTVVCGPTACYTPGPPNYLLGWFLIGGVAVVALIHHLVLNRYPMERDDA